VEKERHVLLVLAVLASSLRVAAAMASVADKERARREPKAKEGVRKARCCCREAFEAMANDEECEIEANKSCTKGVRLLIQLCVVCVNHTLDDYLVKMTTTTTITTIRPIVVIVVQLVIVVHDYEME